MFLLVATTLWEDTRVSRARENSEPGYLAPKKKNAPEPLSHEVLLQELLGEVLEVSLGERDRRGD